MCAHSELKTSELFYEYLYVFNYFYHFISFSVNYNYSRGKPRKNRCGNNVCPQCGRTYVHKYTMQTHIKYECNKEPQFICQFCGKSIYYPSNYKKHLILKHDYRISQHMLLNIKFKPKNSD